MDLNKIKNLIKQNGDKFIVVENGEPELVVMSFAEYEKLVNSRPSGGRLEGNQGPAEPEEDTTSAAIVESIGLPAGLAGLPVRLEDIRLEDLPI